MKRIEKTLYDKDGKKVGWSSKPHPIDKYWSRIKMYFKKDHMSGCGCYWCLKERFSTNIICPKCKKRKLKKRGWHINTVEGPHDSGIAFYCKCGHDSKPNKPWPNKAAVV